MDNTALKTDNGGNTSLISEIVELRNKLSSSNAPIELKENIMRTIDRLERIAKWGSYSSEFESVDKYIDWAIRVPWGVVTEDRLDINNAKELMDSTHYGMDTVKNLILDYLAVMQLQKRGNTVQEEEASSLRGSSANAPVLLFLGLQGVGKTSIAKSIAQAMGRKFARVSLGAIGDVRTLRGTPRHEIDAEPGQIIKALVRTQSMNPVILIDEIEKASGNVGLLNDVMAALLEILDPEQNSAFVDHYLDYPVNLSQVFFICTANNLGGLSAALLDRVEMIRFTSYSDEEKHVIAKSYILPKVLKNIGLSAEQLQIKEEVWPLLIRPVGFDAGIRQLERNIATLARSAARQIVSGHPLPIVITPENVKEYVLPDQGPLN
ncbi:MAG: AAA family ATPase [Candidatus Dojkabacteria bacterium]|jgi:ATP-dependent Lon protease